MHLRGYRPSKKAIFVALMTLSAVALFLPPGIAGASKHGTQLLVPLQDAVYYATNWAGRSLAKNDERRDEIQSIDEGLTRQLASQAVRIEQLQAENERLGRIRNKGIRRALQAQVVAHDVAAWRDSYLVDRGSELGVHRQDWVASRLLLNQGYLNKVEEGRAVIAREVLLGRVEQVSPYMSRVQLFTDIDSPPIEVRVGAIRDGRFEPVDYPCSLRGIGRGKMLIQHVDYRHVHDESESAEDDGKRRISVGDIVCSAIGQLGLPQPMVIGRVTAIRKDPRERLVYDVVVEPEVSPNDVRHVHVIPLIPMEIAME